MLDSLGFSETSLAWRRSVIPKILISLVAAWLSASILRPVEYHVLQLSQIGYDIKPQNKYGLNPEKLAIVLEPRMVAHLAAHLLHTIGVLPSDWPLLYIGSYASITSVNQSYAIQMAQLRGRLVMQESPDWMDFEDEDQLKNVLAMPEFYQALPPKVEWLFMAGTDSIMCSSSLMTMDDWLHYDWVGSPWTANSWHGGSNGFSLRRVSRVKRAMKTIRKIDANLDDSHLMEAVWTHPQAVVPTEETSALFVMEGLWVERPMSYHPSPQYLKEDEGWIKANSRRGIWDHCPELKTIMNMKLAREKCPDPPKIEPPARVPAHPPQEAALAPGSPDSKARLPGTSGPPPGIAPLAPPEDLSKLRPAGEKPPTKPA